VGNFHVLKDMIWFKIQTHYSDNVLSILSSNNMSLYVAILLHEIDSITIQNERSNIVVLISDC
jgi:hypothetical protein